MKPNVVLSGYEKWIKDGKPYKSSTKDNDGVDYIRHCFTSEKSAPLADYEPVDGSIKMNMDEIWDAIKEDTYDHAEDSVIILYIETLSHEMKHKWFVWGMESDWDGTFNEMDERIMRVCSDWNQFGLKRKPEEYDWK